MSLQQCAERPLPAQCPYCSNEHFIKKGFRRTRARGKLQKYQCKNCRYYFVGDDGFRRMRHHAHIITQAIDKYFDGLSSRKCARELNKFSYTSVSHVMVLSWVRTYTQFVYAFTRVQQPALGNTHTSDETCVRTEGEEHQYGVAQDIETRYVTADMYWAKQGNELTPEDITEHWWSAKQLKRPDQWITDGHPSYHKAFKKTFYSQYADRKVEWIRNVTSRSRKYNVYIESVNGYIKERVDTMRGFKARWSAPIILRGLIIHYNFVRPHMSLKQQTPAQRAGIDIGEGLNKWLTLIRAAAAM